MGILAILFLATILFILFFVYWRFYFLRDPVREIPPNENFVLSPTDGRVVKILEFDNKGKKKEIKVKKGLIGKIRTITKDVADKGYLICIMMTPLDVHFQRTPIEGTVKYTKHQKGKFVNAVVGANSLKALENEKNEILIYNKKKKIRAKVIQIAGFVARRIECYVKKNEKLLPGEKIGLINLGSQVVLIIPKIKKLKIKEGQYVYGGTSVIGEIK